MASVLPYWALPNKFKVWALGETLAPRMRTSERSLVSGHWVLHYWYWTSSLARSRRIQIYLCFGCITTPSAPQLPRPPTVFWRYWHMSEKIMNARKMLKVLPTCLPTDSSSCLLQNHTWRQTFWYTYLVSPKLIQSFFSSPLTLSSTLFTAFQICPDTIILVYAVHAS